MTQSISARLTEDMKAAMKAKDSVKLNVVRGLKSAIKYVAIEKAGPNGELDDAEALAVIRREIKKRQDSIEQFQQAGRSELAETEQAELVVLETYLPAALSVEELNALIDEVIAETAASSKKDMGKVMKLLQERSEGRVDNKVLSAEVGKRLA